MNYARQMEIPLTDEMLKPQPRESILDVSSPKLLSLYYADNGIDVVAGDLEDYFVSDMRNLKIGLRENANLSASVFDATERIPFPDSSFDKAFSISVLEHIPSNGDIKALQEISRVLKINGRLAITLPAFKTYVEEWTTSDFYWKSIADNQGRTFFQRRYDQKRLQELIDSCLTMSLVELVLVAEHPIKPPEIGSDGIMQHNSYLISEWRFPKFLQKLQVHFTRLPFLDYFAERFVSFKCQYLTENWDDPNIRQVALLLEKIPFPAKPI